MHLWFSKNTGWLEVISGSMYSGKSEELIRRLKRVQFANQNIIVFKHQIDERYDLNKVVSHNKNELEAIPVSNVKDMEEIVLKQLEKLEVIGIDEVQFFGEEIVELIEKLTNFGKRVIVAGLDQDFRGNPFHPMPELMAKAEYVDKLNAICMVCGNPASRTQRLVNGEPAYEDDPLIMVGAKESYEARCRACHEVKKRNTKRGKLYFIVGTDTEIGKTYVTLKLLEEKKKQNKEVIGLKPIETGLELFENYKGSDSKKYADLFEKEIDEVNIYFFKKALSPHSASKKEKEKIDIKRIKEKIDLELLKREEVYVEGAGGLLVPYNDEYTYLDLICEYKNQARVIVVSKNSLGTINHTLLTIDTLKRNGIKIEGLIFNNKENIKDENFLQENIRIIEKLSKEKVIKKFDFGE